MGGEKLPEKFILAGGLFGRYPSVPMTGNQMHPRPSREGEVVDLIELTEADIDLVETYADMFNNPGKYSEVLRDPEQVRALADQVMKDIHQTYVVEEERDRPCYWPTPGLGIRAEKMHALYEGFTRETREQLTQKPDTERESGR
jgi:hypothetical protein